MYHTPPQNKMVDTRSTAKKRPPRKEEQSSTKVDDGKSKVIDSSKVPDTSVEGVKVEEKCEHVSQKSKHSRTRTSSSSVIAQRKKLELDAAKQKARIQMELIDKKLAADIAALDEKYSPPASETQGDGRDIEEWLERSQHELEKQRVNAQGASTDPLFPLLPEGGGTNGAVQQLASALKDLVTTSVPTSQNANLLSRLSTPRELPSFSGDPMEWLFFKTAYQESTNMCNFSERENLWRLRKCLRGPAKEAVSALLISSTSPEIVMSTLELQFGNSDIIISRILHDVKKLNPLPQDYHKDIVPFSVKIKNFVASVRQLDRQEYLQGVDVVNMVLTKLPTVLLSKWADYSYLLIKEQQKCRLDILSDFLSEEAIKIATCSAGMMNIRWDSKRKYHENDQTVLLQTEKHEQSASDTKCRFCRTSKHDLTDCKKFKRSLRKDRWSYVKRSGLCYKCLLSKHDRQTCPAAACGVDGCAEPHHHLLHFVPSSRQNNNNVTVAAQHEQPSATIETETSETVTHVNSNNNKWSVLLKVVPINIHGPNGVFSTSALLDDGSTVSMISASLASRAGVSGHKQAMRVRGAWDNTELLCDTELMDLTVSNTLGEKYNLSARSVNELNLPKQNLTSVRCENYDYLRNIKDFLSIGQLKPEVLIGQDNCQLILPLETVVGGRNEPCATRTVMGWCLHGVVPRKYSPARMHHSTFFITEDNDRENTSVDRNLHDLNEDVRRYFSVESMGVSSAKPRQNSEEQRAWNHLEQTSTLIQGRWHVSLPWKDNNCTLPDSYHNAMSRLRGVERKMRSSVGYASRYEERIEHLISNDYASEINNKSITSDPSRKIWYLPHFGVDNPNKQKLRLVFDAAAATNGVCLNDYIFKGPDLLISLYGTMLRFRENKIAVTGDIRDMFLRIKIIQEDRDALRFLWRESPDKPVKTYAMSSLIFGANCSPFVAQFIKNKNAEQFKLSMPSAVQAICKQHYMDDYIDSVEDEETAIKLVNDVTHIHKQGGFEIRNWTCNSQAVLNTLPQESLRSTDVTFKVGQTEYDGERTLGLIWNPKDDTLRFDVSFKRIPTAIITGLKRPTKREMLSVVMSIFDVYGFLSPFTINGKIILQETWQLNISWDDPVSDEIYAKWQKWICLLKSLRDVRLPRHYSAATTGVSEKENQTRVPLSSHLESTSATPTAEYSATSVADATSATRGTSHAPSNSNDRKTIALCGYRHLQMHIFCDASTKAFCAVAYWRWIDDELNVRVAFIASKCRVVGSKPITVPRLELQAAVLAARLADSINKEHKMKAERRVFWSDSTTVLHWINNDARNYKTYVANRLGEIDDLTEKSEWRYIPTKINVADIATRESYDCSVLQNEWMYGPAFLHKDCDHWPQNIIQPEKEDLPLLECLTIMVQNEIAYLPVPEPTRFSSWLRLLRSTSRVLTFVDMGLKVINKLESQDDVMDRAERLLLTYSQAQSFSEEIALLKGLKSIPTTSKLLTLSPYLDQHGVLRAGGRIDAAEDVLPEMKRPAILDGQNYIARLIIRHYHVNAAHGNQETVVNEVKQKYWVIRLRPTVKNVVSKCMLCRLRKCKPEMPRLGDLPQARVAHHQRPFTYCGVDLFGPMEVTVGRRHEPRYGVLFTCLTVRAIHIETVATLTTDSFIMALRRMAARRGWPRHIYSDNGTNLRGAHAELKRSVTELDEEVMKNEAENHGTKWSFIPPASPHWGGAWERLIRSVKTSMKIVLKERAPREEAFNTLLSEVENIVNSRPLTHVSVEPGSMETLTPNHFLLGTSLNSPQLGKFDDSCLFLRKQWRISQRLADMFWNRWVREVLPDLIPRKKWNKDQQPLQVGDLVFVVDPNGPRNLWPKGLIREVCPGRDGRVRVVKIETKSGMVTRSASRVARVLLTDECC